MDQCLAEIDVQEIGESFFSEFDKRVSEIPPELCAPFNQEARQLETELTTTYKIVAKVARTTESLEKVAALWGSMVSLCDHALERLADLSRTHPYCGAQQFYDRVAYLKDKCQRLQTMHT